MKITNEIKKQAAEVAEKNRLNVVFVNERGEFFSSENFAALSVKGDKAKYAKIEVDIVSDAPEDEKGTNDLGTVAEVITSIETAESVEDVEAILKAEAEGKNRKKILKAGEKKITELTKNEEQ